MDKEQELKAIKEDVLNCGKCPLCKTRIYPVIGEGSHQAKIMFVGEAPGAREDKTGRPFCGMAGKILDELLNSTEIKREDVYIANILKCRPPGNRDPQEEEIRACVPYLERQIEAIKPQVICPLGRYSMYFLMKKFGLEEQTQPISRIHGKIFEAKKDSWESKIIPFYHPAVLAYNSNMKKYLEEDFKALKEFK